MVRLVSVIGAIHTRDGEDAIGLFVGDLLKLWRLEMVVFGLGFRSMGAKQTCEK